MLYPLSYGGKAPSLTTGLSRDRRRDPGPYAQAMPRVLLVDDDPAILRLLEVNFRMEGFDVDAAAPRRGGDRRRHRAPGPTWRSSI